MTEALVLAGVVAATAAVALWWRGREGRIRAVADRFSAAELAELDAPAGHRVLVEFTAPSCAPCAAARRVLEQAAAECSAVVVRVVDVGVHLDLARRHKVLRAPTTFLVEADGTVVVRIAGVPHLDEVTALLQADAAREQGRAA